MTTAMRMAFVSLACLMAMSASAAAGHRDGMNLYQYVSGMPQTQIDPLGLLGQLDDPLQAVYAMTHPRLMPPGTPRPKHDILPPNAADHLSREEMLDEAEKYELWGREAFEQGDGEGMLLMLGTKAWLEQKGAKLGACNVRLNGYRMGTLRYDFSLHSGSGVVAANSPAAAGVGISLHFSAKEGGRIGKPPFCCDEYKFVQVVSTTHPSLGSPADGIDNNRQNTPFYDDMYVARSGRHQVPQGYPRGGDWVVSTRSIYDAPARVGRRAAFAWEQVRWDAEVCAVCVRKNDTDIVLDCITYGFRRNVDPNTLLWMPATSVEPRCSGKCSRHFRDTVTGDTSVQYDYGQEWTDVVP